MNRRHDIDALRALAFALVILYHVGMGYVADWHWHVKSAYTADWLKWPMVALNLWRMDLVFLVSGLAFSLLSRGQAPARLVGQRSLRLLLPLAFGMAVVVPYQAYAQGVANGLVAPGFVDFLQRYYRGGPWPRNAFDGWDFGITWNHLWYLPYLWLYTALLCLLLPVLRSPLGQRWQARLRSLRGAALLILPVLPMMVYSLLLRPRFPATHDLLHDAWLHAVYGSLFLYGWWIALDAGLWAEFARLRRRSLGLAAALFALLVGLRSLVQQQGMTELVPLGRVLSDLYMWLVVCSVLGWAHQLLNRPWPWLAWANESVYPWYMLHQTLIILALVTLAPLQLGPVLEPLAVLLFTLLGSWALTDGLVRRVGYLRPLFGLKRPTARAAVEREGDGRSAGPPQARPGPPGGQRPA